MINDPTKIDTTKYFTGIPYFEISINGYNPKRTKNNIKQTEKAYQILFAEISGIILLSSPVKLTLDSRYHSPNTNDTSMENRRNIK